MAVTQIKNNLYIGLSTDTKPTTGIRYKAQFIETDTQDIYLWLGASWDINYTKVAEQSVIGGERNGGTSNNLDVTKHECNGTILQNATTVQAISLGAPAYLMGIQAHTALVGTLTVVGLTDVVGAAVSWVIPVGAVGQILPPGNARRCETALTAQLSDGADGPFVIVDWRSL